MFIDPADGLPFEPTPSFFLAGIDIYDREETLGEELEKLDPDNPDDRELIVLRYCLPTKRSYRHKYLAYKCLEAALADSEYDFQSLFLYDPESYSSFPSGWDEMHSARVFFEDVFRLASKVWEDDLQKAKSEDVALW